ncbi:Tim44/TimA family putative adaptor protein [Acetobacter fabarum]|uniref:Tim44/TimA family putative adaptor protein n=1 Tax=Acetobacter fabarum TaxID=483199 RepID=UPI00312BB91E
MDFSLDHFPVDLVLLALVAAFLALRLRSVLGKRVGIQPLTMPVPARVEAAPRVVENKVEPTGSAVEYDVPSPGTRVGQLLTEIHQQDTGFTPQQFLMSVQTVFAQVVEAYARSNRDVLKTYLTPAVYNSFDAAITAREAAGQKQRTDIQAVRSLAIEDVRLTKLDVGLGVAIDVRIVSDQISLVEDQAGQPVTGTDAVTEFSDMWTLERLLGVGGSGWRLAAARSA